MIHDETNHFTCHSYLCEYQVFRLSNQNLCCLKSQVCSKLVLLSWLSMSPKSVMIITVFSFWVDLLFNTDQVESEITGHIFKVMHSCHIFNQ